MILNHLFSIIVLVGSYILLINSESLTIDDHVYLLTKKNFDTVIHTNEITVVFFYAPWCGHCLNMKPFYHKAARILQQEGRTDKPVKLAMIDATDETELAEKYGVRGYPTLKIFRKGVAYDYLGPRRDENAIVSYLAKEASNSWKPPHSRIVTLSRKNFTEWVEKHELSLVEFYAPECAECVKLAPNYEKAAKLLDELSSPIPVAKIDSSAESPIAKKYHVTDFTTPTFLLFRKGRYYEYKGGHQADEIVDYMIRARSGTSQEVKTLNQLKMHIKRPTETYIFGIFENQEDPLYKLFLDFASKYPQEFGIFHSFDPDTFLKYFKTDPPLKAPAILVYYEELNVPKNEPQFRVFKHTPESDLSAFENFIFKESLPLVGFLSPQNNILFYKDIKPICYVFYDVDVELRPHITNIRDKVVVLAKKYQDIKFLLVNETLNGDLLKKYGLDESNNEINIVCRGQNSKVYIYDEYNDYFMDEEIHEFVEKFAKGAIKPSYIKTEPPPTDNDKKIVKVVVGRTIHSYLETTDKEIFMAFIGQAKYKNKAAYEANLNLLATKFILNEDLVFTKINAVKNDYPQKFQVEQDRPSFYYIPRHDKANPVAFRGKEPVALDDLVKFVEHCLKLAEKAKKTAEKEKDVKTEEKENIKSEL